MNKKQLILPELYEKVNTWWPYWVVYNIFINDYKDKFKFIKKIWVKERDLTTTSNNLIKNLLKKIWVLFIPIILFGIYKIYSKNLKLVKNEKNIISHDIYYSFILLLFKKTKSIVNVYHWQWPLYNEIISIWWAWKSVFLKIFLEKIELYVFKKSKYIWFPSIWAYDCYINSTSKINKVYLNKCNKNWKIKILYNWINTEQNYINELFNNIKKDKNELIFTTVSTLNSEKGVDRIPYLLKYLICNWIKIKWILIWSWSLLEKIQMDIKKLELQNNILIYNKAFKKEEIISLFKKSDFYLMLHRISIFDLATLEAMSEWNIPILSNIWWNKEVINGNWILIDESDITNNNYKKVLDFIKNSNIDKLKNTNIEIIKNNFNNKNFIHLYYKLYA